MYIMAVELSTVLVSWMPLYNYVKSSTVRQKPDASTQLKRQYSYSRLTLPKGSTSNWETISGISYITCHTFLPFSALFPMGPASSIFIADAPWFLDTLPLSSPPSTLSLPGCPHPLPPQHQHYPLIWQAQGSRRLRDHSGADIAAGGWQVAEVVWLPLAESKKCSCFGSEAGCFGEGT